MFRSLTLVAFVVVSTFDSAPSLSNTDVRFNPFKKEKQKVIGGLDRDIALITSTAKVCFSNH